MSPSKIKRNVVLHKEASPMTKAEAMMERPAAINADIEDLRDREMEDRAMDGDVLSKQHRPLSARDEPVASSGNELQ